MPSLYYAMIMTMLQRSSLELFYHYCRAAADNSLLQHLPERVAAKERKRKR